MGYRQDDRAISQILGTMLVISIAVVISILAGIMFHHVAESKASAAGPPALGVAQLDDEPEVRIIKVPSSTILYWGQDIRVDGTCTPLLNGQPFAASAGARIEPDDRLACDPGETLHIVFQGDDGRSILYRFEFD